MLLIKQLSFSYLNQPYNLAAPIARLQFNIKRDTFASSSQRNNLTIYNWTTET